MPVVRLKNQKSDSRRSSPETPMRTHSDRSRTAAPQDKAAPPAPRGATTHTVKSGMKVQTGSRTAEAARPGAALPAAETVLRGALFAAAARRFFLRPVLRQEVEHRKA